MSEALIRWMADRQAIAFVLMLVALLVARGNGWIDGAQFMVGYLSLGAGYFGADLFKQKAGDAKP